MKKRLANQVSWSVLDRWNKESEEECTCSSPVMMRWTWLLQMQCPIGDGSYNGFVVWLVASVTYAVNFQMVVETCWHHKQHEQSYSKQEIRPVEHGICPIAKFTSPYWIVRIVTEYRILFSADVVMYMYCLKILSEYWKVTRLFKPFLRYRNF